MKAVFLVTRARDAWDVDTLPGRRDGMLFVAVDSVISARLRRHGLDSQSFAEILPESELEAATLAAFAALGRHRARWQAGSGLVQSFRYRCAQEATALLVLRERAVRALARLAAPTVAMFPAASPEDLVLGEALAAVGTRVETVARMPSLSRDVLGRAADGLPFLGWERKYYEMFAPWLFGPSSLFRRRKARRVADFVCPPADTLVGPVCYREDLAEVVETLEAERGTTEGLLFLLHPRLYRRDTEVLRKKRIPHLYLRVEREGAADLRAPKVEDLRDGVAVQLQPLFAAETSRSIATRLVEPRLYDELLSLESEFPRLLAMARPRQAYLVGLHAPMSRVAAAALRKVGTPSTTFVTMLEQFVYGVRRVSGAFCPEDPDAQLPDELLVSHPTFEAGLGRLFPPTNRVRFRVRQSSKMRQVAAYRGHAGERGEARAAVLRALKLPADSFFVLFTTQQHVYSRSYVDLLARVFEGLDSRWHLVIKVHPKEFELFYSVSFADASSAVHVVKDGVPIERLMLACDLLVTYFSFTAFEALAVGTPVLRLNPTGSQDFPEFEPTVGLSCVETEAQLRDALRQHMALPRRVEGLKPADFD